VVVNAMSPIAVTRMVTAALGRASRAASPGGSGSSTGGLSLGSMPEPAELGPMGAYLVSEDVAWCRGQVIFVGGPEIAVIDQPRLLEVVRTGGAASPARVLEAATVAALAPAEAGQRSAGGGNPRFADAYGEAPSAPDGAVRSCAVVSDRPPLATAVRAALEARGATVHVVPVASGFASAADLLGATVERHGPVDGLVVALAGPAAASSAAPRWQQVLDEHDGIVGHIHADAGWARAVADLAGRTDRPVRLVTLTDGVTAGGRSRAQASAQLARAAATATGDRVAAFAVSVETADVGDLPAVGELAAHLLASAGAPALSGAELVAGPGWFGLRSHPRPAGSITFGGPEVPGWLDGTLRSIVGAPAAALDAASHPRTEVRR
jgi:hypothetical protein